MATQFASVLTIEQQFGLLFCVIDCTSNVEIGKGAGYILPVPNSATLEERVEALESKVEQLLRGTQRKKDWRRTLGMFAGDELMKEINAEGHKIRESDRKATLAAMDGEEAA